MSPPASRFGRIAAAVLFQRLRTTRCPAEPRLDGTVALVTGGNKGIGLATSLGLAERGAKVVIAARDRQPSEAAVRSIREHTGQEAWVLETDLADLESVTGAAAALHDLTGGHAVDLFVANAGIWPTTPARSVQGYEIAFAVNVLGHHVLLRCCRKLGLVSRARVVVVTGDIYVLADDCTPDFEYQGKSGGRAAYCRSKLGLLWWVRQLVVHAPELTPLAVHPGVVSTGLGGGAEGVAGWIRDRLLLDPTGGTQTTLRACTDPGLPAGVYLHNTLGVLALRPGDAAMNDAGAERLWTTLETIADTWPDRA